MIRKKLLLFISCFFLFLSQIPGTASGHISGLSLEAAVSQSVEDKLDTFWKNFLEANQANDQARMEKLVRETGEVVYKIIFGRKELCTKLTYSSVGPSRNSQ